MLFYLRGGVLAGQASIERNGIQGFAYGGSITTDYDFENAYKVVLRCPGQKDIPISVKYQPSRRIKGKHTIKNITLPGYFKLYVNGSGIQRKIGTAEVQIKGRPTPEIHSFKAEKDWFSDKVTVNYSFTGVKTARIALGTIPLKTIDGKNGAKVTGEYTHTNHHGFPAKYKLKVWFMPNLGGTTTKEMGYTAK